MNTQTEVFDEDTIKSQAREWAVALSSGDADKAMLDRFHVWRDQDPRHEEIFQKVDLLWRNMSRLEHMRRHIQTPEAQPSFWQKLSQTFEQFLQPSGAMLASACALVLAVGVFFALPNTKPEDGQPQFASFEYRSGKNEVKQVTLQDGSIVTLGAESHLRFSFSDGKRAANLTSGSALFDIESDPARPFTVMTGQTETRVLGTIFAVEHKPYGVRVAVKEGRVRVGEALGDAQPPGDDVLTAGQAVTASLSAEVSEKFSIDASTVGAWEEGRLVYKNATLKEIVAEANRYYDGKIMLADKATGEQRVSIAFEVAKIDEMIVNLSDVVGLNVNRELPGRVILKLED